MKLRVASLALLCLALAGVPAFADYNNGPINGTQDAWTINFGYVVSNNFKCCKSNDGSPAGGSVTGFDFGVWEFPGDIMASVDWSITSGENSGTVYGSGTASGNNLTDTFLSSNQFGYDVDKISVSGLSVGLAAGDNTYWLNLQNAVVPSGNPVYWDENSGVGCSGEDGDHNCPALASESAVGTIPSEAFTIHNSGGGTGTTPEPSSIMLFGSGLLGVAGILRRKLGR